MRRLLWVWGLVFSAQLFAAPGDILFSDDFERNAIGADWSASNTAAAQISTLTANSGTRSLHTCCTAVTVTSRVFDLSGVAGARLALWLRIGSDVFSEDPDIAGQEDFYIEYLRSSNNWQTLQHVPGGTTPGSVINVSVDLPSDALHAGFRFRFRQTGGSGFGANNNGNASTGWDFYHIDDVLLTETAGIPSGPPFCDDFSGGLNSANWRVFPSGGDAGVSNQTGGVSPPSLFTRWGAVSVESRRVDLSTYSNVEVRVWLQRGSDAFSEDPDAGEDLVVEFLDNNGNWITQETFAGDGTPGEVFNRTYTLPSQYLHANWQIRFRQTGGSGPDWDYWHIDDFCVQPVVPPSAIAEYRFEQADFSGSGVSVVDDSGNGRNAITLGNPATDPNGYVCKGFSVPRNTQTNVIDALNTGVDVDADIGQRGSIAFWFRPNWRWNNGNRQQTLFDAGERYFNSNQDKYFFLQRNRRNLEFSFEDSADNDFTLSTNALDGTSAGTWVHITVVWDLPAGVASIYVNGNLAVSQAIASTGQLGNLGALYFGDGKTNYIVSGRSADGTFDEIKLFDSALSQGQVQTVMNETHPCTVAIDHFKISHDNFGLYCLDEVVTVSARDASDSVIGNFTQTVVLNTGTGRGTWSLVSGAGTFSDATPDDGIATYTYAASDAGTAQFALTYREGPTPINISATLQSNSAIVDDDTEGLLDWAASGFIITGSPVSNPPPNPINQPINTQTAGTNFPIYLTAYGQTPTDPQCGVIESYTGTHALNWWVDYQNPTAGTLVPTIDGTSIANSEAASTPQNVNFVNGQAQLLVKYKDVGQIQLNVKDVTTYSGVGHELRGGSNPFVVRPADLQVTVSGNPAAVDENGPVFRRAGEAFTVTVTALDAEGSITPSFGLEITPEGPRVRSSQLVAPVGGRNGSVAGQLTNGTAFVRTGPGVFTATNVAFDEVGIIRLQADIQDGDYLGTGNVLGTESGNVGRFIPHRFLVTDNTPALRNAQSPWTCSFSYQDQAIGFASGQNPQLTITAVNASGQPTFNYGGPFWKLTTTLPNRTYQNLTPGIGAVLGQDLSSSTVTVAGTSDLTDGQAVWTIDGDTLTWQKASSTPQPNDAPFTAQAQLVVPAGDLTDPDGVCFDGDNNGTCDDYGSSTITGGEIRYGRWFIDNAYGSELLPLSLAAEAQYFDGTRFVTNTDDNCSATYTGWTAPTLGSFSGNLQAGETTLTEGGMNAGILPLTLSAPGEGNDGSAVLTMVAPPWLFYDFDGDGNPEAASALIVFGIYDGRDPVIYWRQRFGR